MAKKQRNRLQTDERRQKLIALGIDLFSRKPYDELSIEEIARRAKISKGLLYHYFPTKREFYIETMREISNAFIEATEMREDMPPLERLQATLDVYFDYVRNHDQAFLAIYRSGIGTDAETRSVTEGARQVIVKRLAKGLGLSEIPPEMENVLYACTAFIEASAIHWMESGKLKKETFVPRLAQTIEVMLTTAATL